MPTIMTISDYLVEEITKHLDLDSMRRWCNTSKGFSVVSDTVWESHCLRLYSAEFWKRASARPHSLSLPLGSAKDELKRLTRWKAMVYPEIWTEAMFYDLWLAQLTALLA